MSGGGLVAKAHATLVAPRRLRQLRGHIEKLLPQGARVLDVGCGDGHLTKLISDARADLEVIGVEVFMREKLYAPVVPFDGRRLPFKDGEFTDGIIIDVLHHADDPKALLREMRRVCSRSLVIKDHLREGPLAYATLALMDLVGNPSHGVAMKRDYWRHQQWLEFFRGEGWRVEVWLEKLDLYGMPMDLICGRGLHFVCRLALNRP